MARFNNPAKDYVFAHFNMPTELNDPERTGIKWLSLADRSLTEMVHLIKAAIKDKTEMKNILILCMQKFVGGTQEETMRYHIRDIVNEARKQRLNKVCFGTAYFVPAHERVWGVVSAFNKDVHIANEVMNIARVNTHKAVMAEIPNSKNKRIRSSQWKQYQLGTGLGNHLSFEGCRNYMGYIRTVFNKTFCEGGYFVESDEPMNFFPQSLATTAGYCNITYFKQLMRAKGILTTPAPAGERMLAHCTQMLPGWREWRVYQDHGKMRFHQKEGVLEAWMYLWNQSSPNPSWYRVEEDSVEVENDGNANEDGVADDDVVVIEDGEMEQIDERDIEVIIDTETMEAERQVEPEKEKERNSNENEYEEHRETRRELTVMTEKCKEYKKALETKEATIKKEHALTKHWRAASEKKEAEKESVLDLYDKLEGKYIHLKEELSRMTKEYEYLRSVYETEGNRRLRVSRLRVTRKFAKEKDGKKYAK